jgi:hypothetical protein
MWKMATMAFFKELTLSSPEKTQEEMSDIQMQVYTVTAAPNWSVSSVLKRGVTTHIFLNTVTKASLAVTRRPRQAATEGRTRTIELLESHPGRQVHIVYEYSAACLTKQRGRRWVGGQPAGRSVGRSVGQLAFILVRPAARCWTVSWVTELRSTTAAPLSSTQKPWR